MEADNSLIWGQSIKWIPSYEGQYAATIFGDIWSFKGKIPKKFKPCFHRHEGRKELYLEICLNSHKRFIHHLILETFIGYRPYGLLACHKNDDKSNNSLENLYWGTSKQNDFDRVINCRFRYSPKEYGIMRFLFNIGLSQAVIAHLFKCSRSFIFAIVHYKTALCYEV